MPEQANRQIELMLLLHKTRFGYTKEALAERFECQIRTIERDFEIFGRLGIRLQGATNGDGERVWRLAADYVDCRTIDMNATEAAALVTASRMISSLLTGSPYADALAQLLDRIRLVFPPQTLDLFEAIARSQFMHIRSPMSNNYEPFQQAITKIARGIRQGKALKIKYKNLRKKTHTTIYDPYALMYYDHGGDLYLWCYSHPQQQRRVLRINRMLDVGITDKSFDPPQDLDPKREFKYSWGIYYDQSDARTQRVQVRFTGLAADFVQEKTFHPSQTLRRDPHHPEAVIATYDLFNFMEFKRWIKQFDCEAEIRSPAWLREEIRQRALAVAALHD